MIIENNNIWKRLKMTDITVSVRDKYFEKIREAFNEYNANLYRQAPEFFLDQNGEKLSIYRRHPVVLMHDMALKVPSGKEYDDVVKGLAELAIRASRAKLYQIHSTWWMPVSRYGLVDLIGQELNTDWKKNMIDIWMDAKYTKHNLE